MKYHFHLVLPLNDLRRKSLHLLQFTLLAICLQLMLSCKPPANSNTVQQNNIAREDTPVKDANTGSETTTALSHTLPAGFSYQVIPSESNTYGYDIYKDGKLIIHQTSVPALPGNKGFKTQALAAAVAEAVIEKINKGEMPPTITTEELEKMGVKTE